jgi:hypothetical protein
LTLELKNQIQVDKVLFFYGDQKTLKKVDFAPLFFEKISKQHYLPYIMD